MAKLEIRVQATHRTTGSRITYAQVLAAIAYLRTLGLVIQTTRTVKLASNVKAKAALRTLRETLSYKRPAKTSTTLDKEIKSFPTKWPIKTTRNKSVRGRKISKRSLPEPATPEYQNAPELRPEVPIFYITNRRPKESQGALASYSDSTLSEILHRGKATVSFPADRHPGELDERWKVLTMPPERSLSKLESVIDLPRSRFHTQLRNRYRKYGNALFIFVHGFKTTFDKSLKRTAQLLLDTQFNGTAISFSWPSKLSLANYGKAKDNVVASEDFLENALRELRQYHPEVTIHVVAHSMGAQLTAKTIASLTGQVQITEVVLQAPDIAKTHFPALATALKTSCERISVYASATDSALALSGLPLVGEKRVGANVKYAFHADVDAIDATDMTGAGWFSHSYAFRRVAAIDLHELLTGDPAPRSQLKRQSRNHRHFKFRR